MVSVSEDIKEQDIIDIIKTHCDTFATRQAAADSLDVSRVFLWKVLEGHVPPTNPMLDKLGYVRERKITHTYRKKEDK
jgi:hypothetical protein